MAFRLLIKLQNEVFNIAMTSMVSKRRKTVFHENLQVVETVRKHVPRQPRLSGLSEEKSWFLPINKE